MSISYLYKKSPFEAIQRRRTCHAILAELNHAKENRLVVRYLIQIPVTLAQVTHALITNLFVKGHEPLLESYDLWTSST